MAYQILCLELFVPTSIRSLKHGTNYVSTDIAVNTEWFVSGRSVSYLVEVFN